MVRKRITMKRKFLKLILGVMLLALCTSAEAQQAGKVPRIGYLDPGSPEASLRQIEALRMGLVELGYLEGKNIVVEYRYADGKRDQLSAAASELVQRQVDVIVTGSTPGVEAAKMRLRRYPLSSLPLVIFAVFALDHFMASARKYLSKE
jgi:putative ABC transport system substrate-binding protein